MEEKQQSEEIEGEGEEEGSEEEEEEEMEENEMKKNGKGFHWDSIQLTKIKTILNREFDIEIHIRSQELTNIENRIREAESLLKNMENYCWAYNPNFLEGVPIPNSLHHALYSSSSSLSSSHLSSNGNQKELMDEKVKPKKRKRIPREKVDGEMTEMKLFARSLDDIYVLLICPTCGKKDFANPLGFINHCRINHGVKFTNIQDACFHCGVPVDESEVPPNDPSRLKAINFILNRKLKRAKTESSNEQGDISDGGMTNSTPILSIQTSVIKEKEGSKISTLHFTEDSLRKEKAQSVNVVNNLNRMETVNQIGNNEEAPACVSRFYVKKKIIVGNVSKSISTKSRENGDESTHKWMVYVRGSKEEPDISPFVKSIRFFLDPSYQPNHIIEVDKYPFTIARRGWGEFPIRVQIHFVDTRNRPINLIHQVKLTNKLTGLQYDGGETAYDIELDKKYFDEHNIPYYQPQIQDIIMPSPKKNRIRKPTPSLQAKEPKEVKSVLTSQMEILLDQNVKLFPLVSFKSTRSRTEFPILLYRPARNATQWKCWSNMKRRAIEWIRARQIKQYTFPSKLPNGSVVSTKTVLAWCRNNIESHLNPPDSAKLIQTITKETPQPIPRAPTLPIVLPTPKLLPPIPLTSTDEKIDEQIIDKLIDEAMGPNDWEQDSQKQHTLDSLESELEAELSGNIQPKSPSTLESTLLSEHDLETSIANSSKELIHLQKEIDESEEIDIID